MAQLSGADLRTRVDAMLNRWPAVGAAFGVVRNGSLEFFAAHGLADIPSQTPVTADTVFRVGSITKTFTAIALMQLWERGDVDLDAPADEYLRAYELAPAQPGWRPATLWHLLTHTAGVPQDLAEYYRGRIRLVAEPGARFRYTDHGLATEGQVVEDVSGLPLDRYLRALVFEPLGMTRTDLVRSERVRPGLATGYALHSGGPQPVPQIQDVTAAAGATYSTPTDMARYVEALLGGGANGLRLRAEAGDAGRHVRLPVPAGPADPGDGPHLLPRQRRRTSPRGTAGRAAALGGADLPWPPTTGSESWPSATERPGAPRGCRSSARTSCASCPTCRRGHPLRHSAASRGLGRPLRLVPLRRTAERGSDARDDGRRRGGLRPRLGHRRARGRRRHRGGAQAPWDRPLNRRATTRGTDEEGPWEDWTDGWLS